MAVRDLAPERNEPERVRADDAERADDGGERRDRPDLRAA